jgi:hypothetical protein
MKYCINIPETEIELTQVCDSCKNKLDLPKEKRNKFVENLKGILNISTKDKNLGDMVVYYDIYKQLMTVQDFKLLVTEEERSKLLSLVESQKGWGDLIGQVELLRAIRDAQKEPEVTPNELKQVK